jgi:hypothetical protein
MLFFTECTADLGMPWHVCAQLRLCACVPVCLCACVQHNAFRAKVG